MMLSEGVTLYSKTPWEHVEQKHPVTHANQVASPAGNPGRLTTTKAKASLAPMVATFVGRIEYTLQSVAWATM